MKTEKRPPMKKRERSKIKAAVKCLQCGKIYREEPFPDNCWPCPDKPVLIKCWTNGEPREMSFQHPSRDKHPRFGLGHARGRRTQTRTHHMTPFQIKLQAEREARQLARKKAQ